MPHNAHTPYRIVELFQKIDFYQKDNNEIAALSVFIEILSLLNKMAPYNEPLVNNQNNINEIINYIHEHRTEQINLTTIASHFYINKQYLCKIFKQSTGYTVHQYINLKRCLLAEELIMQGKTKTAAALEAGFGTYATYYKVRKKLYANIR